MVPEPKSVADAVLVVVGAHLQAEIADRPLAYQLRRQMIAAAEAASLGEFPVVVCTDVWYLNHEDLFRRPCIVLGHPGVNAASAYFANRLPHSLTIDGSLQIQLDPEMQDLRACVWGMTADETGRAVDLFWRKHGQTFVVAAAEALADTSNF